MKKPLYDKYERMIIKYHNDGFCNTKPLIVSRYEISKLKQEFEKKIFKISIPIINFLSKTLSK